MRALRNARTRIVIGSALIGGIAMAAVLGLAYWTANTIIESETRNVVTAELNGLADSYGNLGILGLARAIERRIEGSEEPDALYLLTDAWGRVIAGNIGAWPPTVEPGDGWVELELIRTDNNKSVPISAASIQLRGGERLLVGRDSSARQDFDRALTRSLIIALTAALLLSLMTGWLLTRLVFSRLSEISRTAEDIMSGDLSTRIPLRESGDEFDRLGATLNEMLERIEGLVGNLRMTTDSLAHDLRSPLTRLRLHVETLSDADGSDEDKQVAAERAVREVDHLLRVFSDLTQIARADANIGRTEFETIDLSEICKDVAEFFEPLAKERGVALQFSGEPVTLQGHKALLTQAVTNLLDNAMRYAPKDSEVSIAVHSEDSFGVLSVSDRGPGIPADMRNEILRPFVTMDASRSDGSSGLGLALVASVARLHGGEVALGDNNPGLSVSMRVSCL